MRLITLFILLSISLHAREPFFQAKQTQPYHVSVGAVLFNQEGKIACHHFGEVLGQKDIYILMRESVEDNETILDTLHRGLKEELGATALPVAFIGSLSGFLYSPHLSFDKTTLYVVCQLLDWNPEERDENDPEAFSVIEWHDPETLIGIMQAQGAKFHRIDVDESEMILRALPYIKKLCGS